MVGEGIGNAPIDAILANRPLCLFSTADNDVPALTTAATPSSPGIAERATVSEPPAADVEAVVTVAPDEAPVSEPPAADVEEVVTVLSLSGGAFSLGRLSGLMLTCFEGVTLTEDGSLEASSACSLMALATRSTAIALAVSVAVLMTVSTLASAVCAEL